MLLQLLPKHSAESCFIIILQKDIEFLLGKCARERKKKVKEFILFC